MHVDTVALNDPSAPALENRGIRALMEWQQAGKAKSSENSCFRASVSTIHPVSATLTPNLGLCVDKLVTNYVSYSMVHSCFT
jgi:hypothetical protein